MKSTALLLALAFLMLLPIDQSQAASRTASFSQVFENQPPVKPNHFQKQKKKWRFSERLRKAFSLKKIFKPNSTARKTPIWGLISLLLASLSISLAIALGALNLFLGLIISTALAAISLSSSEMRGPAIASLALSGVILILFAALVISCRVNGCF